MRNMTQPVFGSSSLGNAVALQKAKYNVDKHFAVVGILGKYTTEVNFLILPA
jgi:hypothetical protein